MEESRRVEKQDSSSPTFLLCSFHRSWSDNNIKIFNQFIKFLLKLMCLPKENIYFSIFFFLFFLLIFLAQPVCLEFSLTYGHQRNTINFFFNFFTLSFSSTLSSQICFLIFLHNSPLFHKTSTKMQHFRNIFPKEAKYFKKSTL